MYRGTRAAAHHDSSPDGLGTGREPGLGPKWVGTSCHPALGLPGRAADSHGPRLRGVGLAVLGLVVSLMALRLLMTIATRGTGAPSGAVRPDDVLLVGLAWVGVALSAWLALGSFLALLATLPGVTGRLAGALAERITPLAARKVLTLVLGASVGSVALPPAPVSVAGSGPLSVTAAEAGATGRGPTSADLAPGFVPSRALGGAAPLLDPGFTPTSATPTGARRGEDVPSGPARTNQPTGPRPGALTPGFIPTHGEPNRDSPRDDEGPGYVPSAPVRVHVDDRSRLMAPPPRPTAGTHDDVTVRRGDSLWTVAARHLGPGASDAQVAREWPRWYAANRDVIGDDPDLIKPGQQLRPPTALAAPPSVDLTASVPAERGAHR
ncbi:LysM peptidoglycan-binding domain-containing protein [Terrabacter sp. 2RAF25]|uniref:LysM peptidoglycan-binding domain-containing protein n=1 Tax=Terrabacter sp. 2RAF25 TaxID=3232998 RepID=UPI003F9D781A